MAHILEDKSRTKDVLIEEKYTFNSLFLPDKILQGLKDANFYRPSPIQLKAIPLGRCGLDLNIKAKSGTGKTLVFAVLALETVDVSVTLPQVLILAPTREIAVQIEGVIKLLGKYIDNLHVASFIGGLPIEDDINKLTACHIAIGAPGRLKALVEKKVLQTKAIRLLVLDEADKLMESVFQPDVNFIYHNLPRHKQVLSVSATYYDEVDKFIANYMHSPTFVTPDADSSILLGLQQFVTVVKENHNVMQQIEIKTKELVRLLSEIPFVQCIVFFNFQTRAETLSHLLKQRGWNALYISGSQPQRERLKVIKSLQEFDCRVLLTTDLTARGIDASNVNLVINFEVPFKTSTYLHRMGRAGRYGSSGICVTISSEGRELNGFQKIIGQIGGSDLSIAKVPLPLGNIWQCAVNDLEKVESIIVNDDDVDIKQTVIDLKSVSNRIKKLSVHDDNSHTSAELETPELKLDEPIVSETKAVTPENEDLVSGFDLYPWVPVETSVLSQTTGVSLLGEENSTESIKRRKVSDGLGGSNLTVSKNIALYNIAESLSSNELKVSENLTESVNSYLNAFHEQEQKREKEMEKFFESYSCEDILKNMSEHTEAWCKADGNEEFTSQKTCTETPRSVNNKENIFKISYDFMTKNQTHWREFVDDYSSSDKDNEENNSEYISEEEEEESIVEERSENEPKESSNFDWKPSFEQHGYYNVPQFKQLYDQCSQEMSTYGGTFSDEASASEWYDKWRAKLTSVTNYVQQNIETYEKSRYQHSVYFNNN